MKHFALVGFVLLGSCVKPIINTSPPRSFTEDVSIAIVTRDGGFGHGCPVDGMIYTARHVMWDEKTNSPIEAASWSDATGKRGRVELLRVDEARDLAVVIVATGDQPEYLSFADEALKPNEPVHWWEYLYDPDHVFDGVKRGSYFKKHLAQYLIIDGGDEIAAGASGSCLLNQKGQVIGLTVWGLRVTVSREIGMAVSLLDDRRVR